MNYKISLLDCTLRDGGYVNNWEFGEDVIRGFGQKIAQTRIEFYEVGFIKGVEYNPNRSIFPDTRCFDNVIINKSEDLRYLGMLDMSAPVPKDCIGNAGESSIDGIRVIFKKDKIDEAYEYCQHIINQGYILFVNFVCSDQYTDDELIDVIKRFNNLSPYGMSIVDTFGMIKRKQFVHIVTLMNEYMDKDIALCYHAHNNLQQAFSNAETLVDMNINRDIVIDACVFGMGRGAGNLNLELFAEYMNENYDTHYQIEPMLEIMDEYLNGIYKTKFWGYSLPLYLSAKNGCHPNYAIYLAEKNSLTEKSFNELLSSISAEDKVSFTKEKAETYYRKYLENYVDDKATIEELSKKLLGKEIIILAPGNSISNERERILNKRNANTLVIALNFLASEFAPDYIFSSNMRRYKNIQGNTVAKCITTSNMRGVEKTDYVINFSSCISKEAQIVDNSGLMVLRLLNTLGIKEVSIAGMDGYSRQQINDYCDDGLSYVFSEGAAVRNELISTELKEINKTMKISFITETNYILE